MLLFLSIFGCSVVEKIQSPGDPMCDAICGEQYLYTFSKSLEGYSLRVSFQNMDGETETLEAVFNGEVTEAYAMMSEVELRADQNGIHLYSAHSWMLENIVFEINNTEVLPSLNEAYEDEVCGSVCTISDYTLNTDNIEPQTAELTTIDELNNMFACATDTNLGDLFIIAHNDAYTQALIVHEVDGYDVPGGGDWENGFNNEDLSVELHIGTNVGVNYCTDAFEEEEIAEVFTPIDPSEVPAGLSTNDVAVFSYGPEFLDCEDCEPFARLSVENFWFVSENGNYATIELISELQSDIWFNYAG